MTGIYDLWLRKELDLLESVSIQRIADNRYKDWQCYCSETIFSASGFRRIFAADGDEQSDNPAITQYDFILTYFSALVFAEFIQKQKPGQKIITIAIGRDTRPTGILLASIVYFALIKNGFHPLYLGITAGPEIMAFANQTDSIDGFFYLTASHNPPGHNGFKFGLQQGVCNGAEVGEILTQFHRQVEAEAEVVKSLIKEYEASLNQFHTYYQFSPLFKIVSETAYQRFLHKIFWGDVANASSLEHSFSQAIHEAQIGIIAEFNGSSRILSVDKKLLLEMGLICHWMNDTPGVFAHAIVPEGDSLNMAAKALEQFRQNGHPVHFAYVPDCDGDRGNLVIWNEQTHLAEALPAQTVFALSAMAEIGYAWLTGQMTHETRNAIIVNDCTSGMLDRVMARLPINIIRVETGEANVVNRALQLERDGWIVRIIGEGSNGGNITRPSNTRDPLSTVVAMLKLLVFKYHGQSIYQFFAGMLSNAEITIPAMPSIADYINLLPKFITTNAFDVGSVMKIRSRNQISLKHAFEEAFLSSWQTDAPAFKEKYRFVSYREINYEGVEAHSGWGEGHRSGDQSGGLKIELLNDKQEVAAWLFWRKSKTEDLVRTIVDIDAGTVESEKFWRDWLRNVLNQADTTR